MRSVSSFCLGVVIALITVPTGRADTFLEPAALLAPLDTDGDGIVDSLDNCPGVTNPDQLDADADGSGAACDCNDHDAGAHQPVRKSPPTASVPVVMGHSAELVAAVAPCPGDAVAWEVNGVRLRDAPTTVQDGLATFSPNSVTAFCGGSSGRLALVLGKGAWGVPNADSQAEAYRVSPTSFGTYSARLKAASPEFGLDRRPDTESVVSAFYTYSHDPSGQHSEIDFEIYSNDAREVDLSVWNFYQDQPALQQRITRRVNVANGDWKEKVIRLGDPVGGSFGTLQHGGPVIASYDASRTYNEYRFDWAQDAVVFSILDGSWRTLWECRAGGSSCDGRPAYCTPNCPVPTVEAKQAFNVWAVPYNHCGTSKTAPCRPTGSSYQMLVDSVSYASAAGVGSFSDTFSTGTLDPASWGQTTGCNSLGTCLVEEVSPNGTSWTIPVSWTLSYDAGSCADADGDGYDAPEDCAPFNDRVYPYALEVADGIDNQCPGNRGYLQVDETPEDSGFLTYGSKSEYSWYAQSGATLYEASRSDGLALGASCTGMTTTGTAWNDTEAPQSGTLFCYLNRVLAPFAGSWGSRSDGSGRTVSCP